jgi:hypothetical protein
MGLGLWALGLGDSVGGSGWMEGSRDAQCCGLAMKTGLVPALCFLVTTDDLIWGAKSFYILRTEYLTLNRSVGLRPWALRFETLDVNGFRS